jgi:hypothetical protein
MGRNGRAKSNPQAAAVWVRTEGFDIKARFLWGAKRRVTEIEGCQPGVFDDDVT